MAAKIEQMVTEYALLRLTKGNETMAKGVVALFNDSGVYKKSLEHVGKILLHARNATHLRSVEASLQVIINDIQHLHAKQILNMNQEKTALYLYTLQNLIFNLSDWQFPNEQMNNYTPEIRQKYFNVLTKAQGLGVDGNAAHEQCYTKQYQVQIAGQPELADFEFLDEARIDDFEDEVNKLKHLSVKKKTLNVSNLNQRTPVTDDSILDKVISIVQKRMGKSRLTFAYITNNLEQFFGQVGRVLRIDDEHQIGKVTEAIMRRLLTAEQTVGAGVQQMSAKTAEILDKVTKVVRERLGDVALNIHFFLDHVDNFLRVIGDTVHSNDKRLLARVAEMMMQRELNPVPVVETAPVNRNPKLSLLNQHEPIR